MYTGVPLVTTIEEDPAGGLVVCVDDVDVDDVVAALELVVAALLTSVKIISHILG